MFRLIFLISLILCVNFHPAAAQTVQRDWTPHEQNPLCQISENYFDKMRSADGTYRWFLPGQSQAEIILKWHVSGDQFLNEIEPSIRGRFAACFDGRMNCGLPQNNDIAEELSGQNLPEGGMAATYFRSPPPESAIRYAMAATGDCFGTAADGIYLDEVGLTETALPIDVCVKAGQTMLYKGNRFRADAPEMTDAQIMKYQDWGIMAYNLVNQRNNQPKVRPEVCQVAPVELIPAFMDFYDRQGYASLEDEAFMAEQNARVAEEAKVAAETPDTEQADLREPKRLRLLARNDYQRFGTLDACQMAYSYVFNGINRDPMSFIVDPVPDSALSWALKFEQSHAAGQACPAMPEDLGSWMGKQDPKLFEAYGANEEFRQSKPNARSVSDWAAYVERWMWRNQTFAESNYSEGGNCFAAVWWTRNIKQEWDSFNQAEADFVGLSNMFQRWGAPDEALCAAIPPDVLPVARSTWERAYNKRMNERIRQQAEWDAANRREAARRAEINAAYNELLSWKPPYQRQSELRCYDVESTRYGARQQCFSQ